MVKEKKHWRQPKQKRSSDNPSSYGVGCVNYQFSRRDKACPSVANQYWATVSILAASPKGKHAFSAALISDSTLIQFKRSLKPRRVREVGLLHDVLRMLVL